MTNDIGRNISANVSETYSEAVRYSVKCKH